MSQRVPYALIVLDGAADRPEPDLDGRTPLELARTPNLDRIAKRAKGALIQVLPNNGAPQTHSGMLSLLGYPELALVARRGSLEASVVFGGMRPRFLYARGNLSSLVNGRVSSRRVNRDVSQLEADAICDLLNSRVPSLAKCSCRFRSYSTYRLAIEIEIEALNVSYAISGTDPGYSENEYATPAQRDFEPIPSRALDGSAAAMHAADQVNAITSACNAVLDSHPVNRARLSAGRLPINHILMRDFGAALPPTTPFSERWGLRAKYFHDLPVELGVARYLEMDHEEAGCSSVTEAAFADAARRLLAESAKYGFIAFHVKGPDEPGHDGDWRGKVSAIETVDAGLFSTLLSQVEQHKINLVVTSDHATCWAVGTHTADPVPLIHTMRGVQNDTLRLTEKHCSVPTSALRNAWDLMSLLVNEASA